jgi:hypothetical protein
VKLIAVVVAVPALLIIWQWWSDARTESRLGPVASAIAGRDVEVDCQSFWGNLLDAQSRHGEVWFGPDGVPEARIFLTHPTCGSLADFAGKSHHTELDCLAEIDWNASVPLPLDSACYDRSSDTVYALLTLAHEAYHTAGVRDEAVANCFAIQAMGWAASALGASIEESERVALAMAALAPYQRGPYATSNCRSGSEIDLHPETVSFPSEQPLAPPHGLGGSLAAGSERSP